MTGEIIKRSDSDTTRWQFGAFSEIGNCKIGLVALLHQKWPDRFKKRQTFAVAAKGPAVQEFIYGNASLPDISTESVLVAGQHITVSRRHRDKYPEGICPSSFVHSDAAFAVEMTSEVFKIGFPYRHPLSIKTKPAKSKPAESRWYPPQELI